MLIGILSLKQISEHGLTANFVIKGSLKNDTVPQTEQHEATSNIKVIDLSVCIPVIESIPI